MYTEEYRIVEVQKGSKTKYKVEYLMHSPYYGPSWQNVFFFGRSFDSLELAHRALDRHNHVQPEEKVVWSNRDEYEHLSPPNTGSHVQKSKKRH